MVPDCVDYHIILLAVLREVLPCIVDDVVRANLADHLEIPRARNPGDFGSEGLCDLDRERADSARCPVDQYFLTGLDVSSIAESLQCGECCDWDGCGFFKGA